MLGNETGKSNVLKLMTSATNAGATVGTAGGKYVSFDCFKILLGLDEHKFNSNERNKSPVVLRKRTVGNYLKTIIADNDNDD